MYLYCYNWMKSFIYVNILDGNTNLNVNLTCMSFDHQRSQVAHSVGYDGWSRIPQTSLAPILTYPLSPHEAPQEFLTRMYSSPSSVPCPTARTPWSSFLPQSLLVITPL